MKIRKLLTLLLCPVITLCCFACGGNSDDGKYRVSIQNKEINISQFAESDKSAKISVTVRDDDGQKLTNPEVKFRSENEKIATVSDDGVVKGVSVGQTTVTATYKKSSAKVTVNVLDTISESQVNSFDDRYIHTFGRNFITEGKLNLHHVASGIELNFYGSSLTANLSVSDDCYGHVYVDDDAEGSVIKLETKENFVIAENLAVGTHTLRFLKCNELDECEIQLSDLSADKFLTPPVKSKHKIEFIGDSLTCGYGALGGSGKTLENSDACLSYAYVAAQMLGWDFSLVACSGIGVNRAAWTNIAIPMTQLYKQVSWTNTDDYDFADANDVDVVVLSLGSNDAGYIGQADPEYGTTFSADYADFLAYIRSKRPKAYIVCTYGMAGKEGTIVDNGITNAVKSMNDAKISYFTGEIADNGGANGHPSESAQKMNGKAIVNYINTLIAK